MATYANITELKNKVDSTVYNNDINDVEANDIRDRIKDVIDYFGVNTALAAHDIIYVSASVGNDATGTFGNINKPFSTIQEANLLAIEESIKTIIILDGNFTGGGFFTSDITYIFINESAITYSSIIHALGFSGKILGYPSFYSSGNTSMLDNCSAYIEFSRIAHYTNSNPLIAITSTNDFALTLKGNRFLGFTTNNESKVFSNHALIEVGYEGVTGYSNNSASTCHSISVINSVVKGYPAASGNYCLFPIQHNNIKINIKDCILNASNKMSSNCFGIFNGSVTGTRVFIQNSLLISSATAVSISTIPTSYVYSIGTISDKPLDPNSTEVVGTITVDADLPLLIL